MPIVSESSRELRLRDREGWQNGYCTSLENWRAQALGGSSPSPSVQSSGAEIKILRMSQQPSRSRLTAISGILVFISGAFMIASALPDASHPAHWLTIVGGGLFALSGIATTVVALKKRSVARPKGIISR